MEGGEGWEGLERIERYWIVGSTTIDVGGLVTKESVPIDQLDWLTAGRATRILIQIVVLILTLILIMIP